MRHFFIFFLILFFNTPSVFSMQGQDLGNGGDLVYCQRAQDNSLEGFYSLDYLIATSFGKTSEIYPPKSVDSGLDRIENNLKEKIPELWASFHDFRTNLFMSDFLSTRIWEAAPYQLIEIADEELGTTDRIPPNCKGEKGVKTSQAVIHLAPGYSGAGPGVTLYRFMPTLINELSATRPLQISFLLIHEWLWDHSSNVDRNRRLNHFFHSKDFDRLSRIQILTLFEHLGLSIPQGNDKAFNPHFYAFSCQNDLDQLNEMIRNQGENNWNFIKEKSFRHYRQRRCNNNGCSPWSLFFPEEKAPQKMHLYIDSKNKKIIFSSSQEYRPSANELVCSLGVQHLECVTTNTKRTLIGTAGPHCLRVDRFQSQTIPGSSGEWIEHQMSYSAQYEGLSP